MTTEPEGPETARPASASGPVWSARYIFGDATGDAEADTIPEALRAAGTGAPEPPQQQEEGPQDEACEELAGQSS